jgi:hypothetical protein
MENQSPFKWRHFETGIILAERALVLMLCADLPYSRRDDAGRGTACGLHYPFLVGPTLRTRTGLVLQW